MDTVSTLFGQFCIKQLYCREDQNMKACLYQALDLRDNEKTHTQYSVDPVKLFCISITNENLWLNFLLSLGSITSFYFVCIKNVITSLS